MKVTNVDERVCRQEIVEKIEYNMFVEAGAGAGKTRLIVDRIVNQLRNGYAPGEIVAITFTNAAAEELKERISREVEKAGLSEALSHLDEMNISTIHSFCSKLLREQCMIAEIPFGFEIMDEDEAKKEQDEYFRQYLLSLTTDDWARLEQYAPSDSTRFKMKMEMNELFDSICDFPESRTIELPKMELLPSAEAFLNGLEDYIEDMEKSILKVAGTCFVNADEIPDDVDVLKTKDKLCSAALVSMLETFSMEDKQEQKVKFLTSLKKMTGSSQGKFFRETGGGKAYDAEKVKKGNEALLKETASKRKLLQMFSTEDDELDILRNFQEGIRREKFYGVMVEYVQRAAKRYRERHYDKLSNDNLLTCAMNFICNKWKAVDYSRYKCIYVDEFQDTDRVQEKFIYRLASDPNDPEHRKLRDGALFVVGDPKQSIYRFRGAQPEVYFDVKERMAADDMTNTRVYDLAYNYRSNDVLVDWINKKFVEAENVTPIVDGHPYIRMEAKNTISEGMKSDRLICGIYKYRCADALAVAVDAKGKEKYVYNEGEQEDDIKAVTALIKTLVEEDYEIADFELEGEKKRRIKYSDFLLLCRSKKKMKPYLEALLQEGIPVHFDGENEVLLSRELNTFVRLYGFINNYADSRSRIAAQEALRVCGFAKDLREKEFVEYVTPLLDNLCDGAKGLTVYGKAIYLEERVMAWLQEDKEYDAGSISMLQANLRQMIEKVFYDNNGTGIEIYEAFCDYLEKGVEHTLSLDEDADAVRFMNLHKAKGLEGNIVILLDRRGRKRVTEKSPGAIKLEEKYYPSVGKWSSVTYFSEYVNPYLRQEDLEFHRLEYVAVTRAKQAFVFMDCLKHGGLFATQNKDKLDEGYNYRIDDQPSLGTIIDNGLRKLGTSNRGVGCMEADTLFTEMTREVPKWDREKSDLYVPQNPSKLEKTSCGKADKYIAEAKKSGRSREDELNDKLPRPVGNIIGNVLHRTMELLVGRYNKEKTDDELVREISKICARQAVWESKDEIVTVAKGNPEAYCNFAVAAAFHYYKWLVEFDLKNGIKAFYTEYPFSYYDEEKRAGGRTQKIWMNGTADLLLELEDGAVQIIDYKSDNDWLLNEEQMEECLCGKYGPQLDVYKNVAGRIFGCSDEKISVGIISFSQKDRSGKKYGDETVRVRYTQL